MGETKKCPFCDKESTSKNVICEFCGKNLYGKPNNSSIINSKSTNTESKEPTELKILQKEFIQHDGSISCVVESIKKAHPNIKSFEHISTIYFFKKKYEFEIKTTFKGKNEKKEIDTYEATVTLGLKGYIKYKFTPFICNLVVKNSKNEIIENYNHNIINQSNNDRFKAFMIFIIGSIFCVFIFSIGTCTGCKNDSTPQTSEDVRNSQVERIFSQWDGSLPALTNLIKKSMNNPSSYEHVQTRYTDNGDYLIVKTTFRGKNAFGGLVTNSVTAKVSMSGKIIEVISQ